MAHLTYQTMPTAKAIRLVREAKSYDEPGVLYACFILGSERCPKPVFMKSLDLWAEARAAGVDMAAVAKRGKGQ